MATKKVSKASKSLVMAQPSVEDCYVPEVGGKKLSLVEAPFTKSQILTIFQRTPKTHVFNRPGKGGGTFEYVTGVYIKKVLNYVFGFRWDFEVVEHGIEQDQLWVLGKLKVYDKTGVAITKMQFGRADIKYKKGTKQMVDFGNDLKAATTDSLKKCASEFGIASDVYGKNEFKDIGVDIVDDQAPKYEEPVIVETPKIKNVDTGLNTDYAIKLKAEVIKMNNGKAMTNDQILDFINKKLGSNFERIGSRPQAQMILAQLLQKGGK